MPPRYYRPAPAAALPESSRHRGFLAVNRRLLAVGSLASSGLLMCIPALPASADAIVAEVEVPNLQSYAAPAFAPAPVVVRDAFGVTEYSLVQWPVPAITTMTSGFGYRDCAGCSSDHKGIDLTPGEGYPVQSIADGVVVLAEESDTGLGVHVVVEHVIDGQTVRSVYAHMQFGSLQVAEGDSVAIGQQLGAVGNTGASTGPHLHFEIIVDEIQINPLDWLLEHANS
ncbi:M23 family metallopeptidase [Salinibacterium soli]|uniref:M23 family metallopeptidase n=1 Tax=Antiquaquibacter soli TaxID=3064523 RepID=A0ABT9BMY5_9MICO|nr:M23 family metallopeptidase [Protaetiibacter sp. WY-16]MDO7882394.1 M23 family metallopeptidase [Protaetiibacter sp. WY-16]